MRHRNAQLSAHQQSLLLIRELDECAATRTTHCRIAIANCESAQNIALGIAECHFASHGFRCGTRLCETKISHAGGISGLGFFKRQERCAADKIAERIRLHRIAALLIVKTIFTTLDSKTALEIADGDAGHIIGFLGKTRKNQLSPLVGGEALRA